MNNCIRIYIFLLLFTFSNKSSSKSFQNPKYESVFYKALDLMYLNPDSSLMLLEHIRNAPERLDSILLVDSYNLTGTIYYIRDSLSLSEKYLSEAVELAKEYLTPQEDSYRYVLNNYANLLQKKANYRECINIYNQLINIEHDLTMSASDKATTYFNISNIYGVNGDCENAFKYLNNTLEILQSGNELDSFFIARTYLAKARRLFDCLMEVKAIKLCLDEAARYLPQSRETSGVEVYIEYRILRILYFLHIKRHDNVKVEIEKLKKIYDKCNTRFRLHEFYKVQGDYWLKTNVIKSEHYYHKYISYNYDIFNTYKHPRIAEGHFKLAKLYFIKGDIQNGECYLIKSIKFLTNNDSLEKFIDLKYEDIVHQDQILEYLKYYICFLLDKDHFNHSNHKHIKLIKVYFEILYEARINFNHILTKERLNKFMYNILDRLLLYRSKLCNNNLTLLFDNMLFSLIELNKSSALFDKNNLPNDVCNKYNIQSEVIDSIKREIYMIKRLIYKNADKKPVYRKKLLLSKAHLETLINTFSDANNNRQPLVTPPDIDVYFSNNSFQDDLLVISYFIGSEYIYVYTIKGSDIKYFSFNKNKLSKLESLLDFIKTKSYRNIIKNTKYELITKPIELNDDNGVNKLIFIPDGKLIYFPIAYIVHSYFGPKYDISVVPSYSFVNDYKKTDSNNKSTLNICIFSPNFFGESTFVRACNNAILGKLMCNKKESNLITNILSKAHKVKILNSIQEFNNMSFNADIIHLATHACVDKKDYKNSRIYFSDGYLFGDEISNLNLKAKLAVLSACNTGYGKLFVGEGVMSLAKAFLHAGCQSVLMSLWSVDDCATAEIMSYFYKHLSQGKRKDESLRLAKLDYLETADRAHRHPYYWAGFVLVGNPNPIFPKPGLPIWAWIGIASGAAITGAGGYRYYQHRQAA